LVNIYNVERLVQRLVTEMRWKRIIIISCLIIATILLTYLVVNTIINKPTTLYVDPQTIKRTVGQDFSVNISISNVADLYGWQLQLSCNETGSLLSLCNRWGNVSGVNGSGVLATVQFHVKGTGECDLHLYETILVSSSEKSITHIVKSGEFST
jgi:hypothetical protein